MTLLGADDPGQDVRYLRIKNIVNFEYRHDGC